MQDGSYAVQETVMNLAVEKINEHNTEPSRAVAWAVMEHVESETDNVTVGYGYDREMAEGDTHPDSWWERFPPVEGHRFRVFAPEGGTGAEYAAWVLSLVGATPVGVFPGDVFDSYDHVGRTSYHFILTDHAPIAAAVSRLA